MMSTVELTGTAISPDHHMTRLWDVVQINSRAIAATGLWPEGT